MLFYHNPLILPWLLVFQLLLYLITLGILFITCAVIGIKQPPFLINQINIFDLSEAIIMVKNQAKHKIYK